MILITEEQYSLISEAFLTKHMKDRINLRVNKLGLTDEEKRRVNGKIFRILNTDFTKEIDFAIKILRIAIDPENPNFYLDTFNGKEYPVYKITDEEGNDSIGDEIWVVIKNNSMITLMLRKSYNWGSKKSEFSRYKKINWS